MHRTRRRVLATLLVALLAGGGVKLAAADTRLPDAARSGERQAVFDLLHQKVDVDLAGADGTTALHWAAYRDDKDMAARLIEAGAHVNLANRYGVTPLALASTNGNLEMVTLLLAAGADANLAPRGEPVIMTAARTGKVEVVEALLAHGADVYAADEWRGQTALMWAAVENHADVVRALLKSHADVYARSNQSYTALLFAARQGHLEVARMLVDAGADVNDVAPNSTSVLALAIENLRFDVARFLLDQGANPNARNRQGETSLHAAVRARAPAGLRRRPLSDADSLELVERLLSYGGDPDARTPKAPRITDEMVNAALRPAIDNILNLGGATPFLLAAESADVDAMRVLLDYGADPRLATYENTTAAMVAAGVGFVEGRARVRPEAEALEAVKLAVEAGVDVGAANEHGQTAVHGAVYRAANLIIQFLAEAGASIDVKDELGRTPLQLAERGFNQVSSVIRRDNAAALLRQMTVSGPSGRSAR